MDENKGYISTFTNQYGEQWWFDYDEELNLGIIWGADVDYHKYIVVEGGRCPSLVLDQDEKDWLKETWNKYCI